MICIIGIREDRTNNLRLVQIRIRTDAQVRTAVQRILPRNLVESVC